MALSSYEFDRELARNILNKVGDKFSKLNTPPEKVAPSIYGDLGGSSGQFSTQALQPKASEVLTPPPQAQQPLIDLKGTPKIDLRTPGQEITQPQPAVQQPSSVKLSNGITYTPGENGVRTFAKSFDDGGTVNLKAWGRTGPASNPTQVGMFSGAGNARQAVAGQPAVPLQQSVDKTPLEISMENSDRMKTPANQGAQAGPRYLSRAEGDALGLGWKGRLGKYKEDVDIYNRETGNRAAMDIERMREGGAGARSLLMADLENKKMSMLDSQFKSGQPERDVAVGVKQAELSNFNDINKARDEYLKTPTKENEAKLRALMGKFDDKRKYDKLAEYDDDGNKIGETLYDVESGTVKGREVNLTRHTDALGTMKDDAERKQYLQNLKAKNPAAYEALRQQLSSK